MSHGDRCAEALAALLVLAGCSPADLPPEPGSFASPAEAQSASLISTVENGLWQQIPTSTQPSARGYFVMAYDSGRAKTVLFGGRTATSNSLADTWEYDGPTGTWTRVCTGGCTSPPARAFAAMDYDSVRQVTVLFGGMTATGTVLNDTWEWNGSTWTQVCTSAPCKATVPAARVFSALSYDPVRGVSVLFGGSAATPPPFYNDTWTWDGTSWVQQCSGAPCNANLPAARRAQGQAFDASRGVTLIFGGSPNGGNETWAWNGSAWTQLCTTAPCNQGLPSSRDQNRLAYDPFRQVTLSGFGGSTNEVWSWNGSAWAQECTTASCTGVQPPGRVATGLVFDTARGRAVAFGGVDSGGAYLADTWEFHARGESCTAGGQCDTAQCVDGVCCEQTACGTCQACDLAPVAGVCSPVQCGPDPDTCSGTNICDPSGTCLAVGGQTCTAPSGCASGQCVGGTCATSVCELTAADAGSGGSQAQGPARSYHVGCSCQSAGAGWMLAAVLAGMTTLRRRPHRKREMRPRAPGS